MLAVADTDEAPIQVVSTISGAVNNVPDSEMDALLLGRTRELVASTPNQRNWRGILIALLVIMAVLGLIVFSIVLLSPPDEGPRVKGDKLQRDHLTSLDLHPPKFNGSWLNDAEFVFRDIHGGVSVYNADTLSTRVLMTNSTFRQLNAVNFSVSSDLNYVLLVSDVKKVYRYSTEARYSIYEVTTENHFPLKSEEDGENEHPHLQQVQWSPRGNALAFVYKNDVFFRPAANNADTVRVSSSGQPGVVFNGVPDWLYEEEILKSARAFWFSKDGAMLLFATFNDTAVGEMQFSWYGGLAEKLPYPKMKSLRYPKAGTANPEVSLYVADLSAVGSASRQANQVVNIKPTATVADQEHYFTAVAWAGARQVAVVWMNRRQNMSVVSICSAPSWQCEDSHVERQVGRGWVELYEAPLFAEDGASYVVRLPVLDGDAGRFQHVNQISVAAKRVTALTHGTYEVTSILAWDAESHYVYFMAAPEGKPGQRHLYRVLDQNASSTAERRKECLTCPEVVGVINITDSDYGPCLYSNAYFSPTARFYVHECLGPEPPVVWLVDAASNLRVALLDDHPSLRNTLATLALPRIKTFEVEIEGGYQAQVRLFLPPGLREYEEMSFPLVLHVDAAPGSQLVSERWGVEWGSYLASQRNFIVAEIDARGSGFQGDKLRHELYHKLGSVEIEDQIAVIKYLRDNLKYIDKEHLAVWGWSYGGFATAMILAQDEEVFRCGISVAPITSWIHYNSAFTERYMGLPNVTDNYRGYEESDVTKRAGNLREKLFLLIHGTADNNVHYQQSMMLIQALTAEGVLFRHQTYPDEDHSFSGVRGHMYKAMESFLDDCFGPLDFEEWEIGTSFFTFKQ
ncbi:inactive dipeptidyl peptidase 10-like isoform X3 [Neocloeon triangulifer]|uniref:inactive dipeptidyl peptidase 10-like isoform X3 n=1 Tax=Neocloeon triangulifer TaxID=2078957 RepID=UPI00286F3E17|nr:inactive dipeptidyl peptidase 10-like isoform X3 [Neocloeon triangulifer]